MDTVKRYVEWESGVNRIYNQTILDEAQRRARPSKFPINRLAAGCLTPKEHKTLFYSAQGLTACQIASLIGATENIVRNTLNPSFYVLDATSITEASLKGIVIGALGLDQLVDPEEIDRLSIYSTDRKGDILDALIEDYGRRSSNQQIAQKLSLSKEIVANEMHAIRKATGIPNKPKLAIVRFALSH